MNLYLRINALVPNANYEDVLYQNDEEGYDAIIWNDVRTKPTWTEILAADEELGYDARIFVGVKIDALLQAMAPDLGDTVPVGTLLPYVQLKVLTASIYENIPVPQQALELQKAITDFGEIPDTGHEAIRQEIITKLNHWIP